MSASNEDFVGPLVWQSEIESFLSALDDIKRMEMPAAFTHDEVGEVPEEESQRAEGAGEVPQDDREPTEKKKATGLDAQSKYRKKIGNRPSRLIQKLRRDYLSRPLGR